MNRDDLAVLRDSREEASGLCFDAAVTRFLRGLQQEITEIMGSKRPYIARLEVNTSKRFRRYMEINVILARSKKKPDNGINYGYLDVLTGFKPSASIFGHIFESNSHQSLCDYHWPPEEDV